MPSVVRSQTSRLGVYKQLISCRCYPQCRALGRVMSSTVLERQQKLLSVERGCAAACRTDMFIYALPRCDSHCSYTDHSLEMNVLEVRWAFSCSYTVVRKCSSWHNQADVLFNRKALGFSPSVTMLQLNELAQWHAIKLECLQHPKRTARRRVG